MRQYQRYRDIENITFQFLIFSCRNRLRRPDEATTPAANIDNLYSLLSERKRRHLRQHHWNVLVQSVYWNLVHFTEWRGESEWKRDENGKCRSLLGCPSGQDLRTADSVVRTGIRLVCIFYLIIYMAGAHCGQHLHPYFIAPWEIMYNVCLVACSWLHQFLCHAICHAVSLPLINYGVLGPFPRKYRQLFSIQAEYKQGDLQIQGSTGANFFSTVKAQFSLIW
jgi:hypothetical protein